MLLEIFLQFFILCYFLYLSSWPPLRGQTEVCNPAEVLFLDVAMGVMPPKHESKRRPTYMILDFFVEWQFACYYTVGNKKISRLSRHFHVNK